MAFSDWLIIGGVGLLVRSGLKKSAADRAEMEEKEQERLKEVEKCEAEWDRWVEVNNTRKNTPCCFGDGITYSDFIGIANRIAGNIKRINNVSVKGPNIYCNVESHTGCSEWDFQIDYNDWGHITGTYWIKSENNDSSIPDHYGTQVSRAIYELLDNRESRPLDSSDYVDDNRDLGTPSGLNYCVKKPVLKRIFNDDADIILVGYSWKKLVGEHLYPVISILKRKGFINIKSIPIKDIDDKNEKYRFQVEQIVIDGMSFFECSNAFPSDAEITITYHEKKEITFSYSEDRFKRRNYIDVKNQLQELGFSQIYARKIPDLVTGWIVKKGSVEKVVIGDNEEPIRRNIRYLFDEKIVIWYHSKK